MALNEQRVEEFKQRLRDMSDEEIRLGLDTNTINLAWERSLAEQELERREHERQEESDLAKANQRIAELQTKLLETRTELSNVRSESVWTRWQTIAGWVAAAIMLLALFV